MNPRYAQERRKGLAQVKEKAREVRRDLGLLTPEMMLLDKMAQDPPGTVRTMDERRAFEREWDHLVDLRS